MLTLEQEFSRIQIGAPAHFRNLTLFPLLRAESPKTEPDYLLAEEAIGQGLARITELNGSGSVPELRFENQAAKPVLLLDGEELIGAKQNRVLNLTILAPARQTIVIPVSCVEAGRWHMQSPEFTPAPHVMYTQARAARAEQVTESMRATGTRRSDQSAVWSDIAAKAVRMAAPSPTGAMSAMYERHKISVDEYVHAFAWQPFEAGVAFAIGGRLAGLDLFGHGVTLRTLFPKLIRSYALDALDAPQDKCGPASRQALDEFLGQAAAATAFTQPAAGLGKDVRISGPAVSGAALWHDEYVHVCAFATNHAASGSQLSTRFCPPTHRRR